MVFAIMLLVMNFWSAYLVSVKFDHFINLKPLSTCAERPKELVGHQLTHTHKRISSPIIWRTHPTQFEQSHRFLKRQ